MKNLIHANIVTKSSVMESVNGHVHIDGEVNMKNHVVSVHKGNKNKESNHEKIKPVVEVT